MINWFQNPNYRWNTLIYSAILALSFFNVDNFFFWDTVQLGSKHANFYLSTHFSQLLLPDHIDSGHIPTFGFYIALIWEIFGRSVVAAHLAMLPFVLGIVYQLSILCRKFIPQRYAGFALLLLICDPTLLAQMILVSPDIPLFFFFLMGINSVLNNQRAWLALAVTLLFLISMRGMMISLCLLALDLYCNVDFKKPLKKIVSALSKKSLIYFPALIIFLAYNWYHYQQKGWIGFHADSPWAESFASVDLRGFLYNIGILGWRTLDFGRLGIWLVFAVLVSKYYRKYLKNNDVKLLTFFFIVIVMLLPVNMLWAKGLMGHRYLMPIYFVFSLLCAKILFSDFVSHKLKYSLSAIWLIVLLTGNLWIYPKGISQGWDSSLAHLPYYKLRLQTLEYLKDENIPAEKTQSFFPNIATFDQIDLNDDQRNFNNFDGNGEFVLSSNIYNLNEESYELLKQNYQIQKTFSSHGVSVSIHKRKL